MWGCFAMINIPLNKNKLNFLVIYSKVGENIPLVLFCHLVIILFPIPLVMLFNMSNFLRLLKDILI